MQAGLAVTSAMRAVRIVAAVVAVLVVGGFVLSVGCSAPDDRSLPPPRSTSSTTPEPSTTRPDHSRIALAPVEGVTTSAPPIERGDASLRGVVSGPDGALPDAVVRVERLVGDAVQRTDVRTGPDGRYEFVGVPGGRYRVRAFLPPTLTSERPEIFFLVDGEERELSLPVVPFTGLVARASSTPGAPTVGGGVNLAVRVAQREVDGEGIGRETPLAGAVVRVSASGWTSLDEEPRKTTDASGVAVFEYRCDSVGPASATAVVGVTRRVQPSDDPDGGGSAPGGEPGTGGDGATTEFVEEVFPLEVPACGPRPTTTTTTSSTTTTTTAPGSSSTSGSTSTTAG